MVNASPIASTSLIIRREAHLCSSVVVSEPKRLLTTLTGRCEEVQRFLCDVVCFNELRVSAQGGDEVVMEWIEGRRGEQGSGPLAAST